MYVSPYFKSYRFVVYIKNFRRGSTTDWVKESEKYFLHALYGVFIKNILQPMEVISLSRKAMKRKQDNFMEITDVL